MVAAHDVDERVEIISCRMEFDADPEAFAERHKAQEDELRTRIDDARAAVREVALPVAQLRRIAGICAHLGVDGLRGDIVVARAAAAHAGPGAARESIDGDDIAVAVELALPHRRRRDRSTTRVSPTNNSTTRCGPVTRPRIRRNPSPTPMATGQTTGRCPAGVRSGR